MLQDRAKQAFQSAKKKFGGSKSAREAADTPKSGPSKAKEAGSNAIQGGHGLVGVLRKSFDKRGDEDARQHREVMQSQRRQTSALREVQGSVSSIQNMMQKDRYGPKVEPYKRDQEGTGASVRELTQQLGEQHRELMQELQQIRYAIMNIDGLGGGMFGGGWGGRRGGNRGGGRGGNRGGGGFGRNRGANRTPPTANRTGGAPRIDTRATTARNAARAGGTLDLDIPTNRSGGSGSPSTRSSSASWGSRLKNAVTGATHGGGWRTRALEAALTGGAAIYTGIQMFGGSDTPSTVSGGNSGSSANVRTTGPVTESTAWSGLGSISQSNESTDGVHTISSGRGDHGGVSYGAHQLASANGSMTEFLESSEGAPFAPAFQGMRPGSQQFNQRYAQVADEYETEFARAQSNYIKRTHYEPMLDNVREGSGVDLSGRGPAVQEMLYSTGVQYGTGTSVINRALRGQNANAMSDAEIINAVQNYKAQSVGRYFRSSSANVQQSVARRAVREKGQLLALNEQFQSGELDGMMGAQSGDELGPAVGTGESEAQVAQTSPAQNTASPQQSESDGLMGSATVAAAGVGAGALALGGKSMVQSAAPTPAASAPASTPSAPTSARAASAPPASIRAPSSTAARAGNAVRGAASGASSAGKGLIRRLPGANVAFGAIDAAMVVSDDSLTTGEKAGAVTDIAGGTAGGAVGAQAGAAAGGAVGLLGGPLAPVTVPVGAAIGGIAGGIGGYWAGSNMTKKAREWVSGWWGDEEDEADVESSSSVSGNSSGFLGADVSSAVEQARESQNADVDSTGSVRTTGSAQEMLAQISPSTQRTLDELRNGTEQQRNIVQSSAQASQEAADRAVAAQEAATGATLDAGAVQSAAQVAASVGLGAGASAAGAGADRSVAGQNTVPGQNVSGGSGGMSLDPKTAMAGAAFSSLFGMNPMSMTPTGYGMAERYGNRPPETAPSPAPERRPATVREGNQVTHDFTGRQAPSRGPAPPEYTDEDISTRPVGSSPDSSGYAAQRMQARSASQRPSPSQPARRTNARAASRSTGPAQGFMDNVSSVSPIPGTSPSLSAGVAGAAAGMSVSSVSQSGRGSIPDPATSASDISTRTVNETPSGRSTHDSVRKVMMVDPTVSKTHERKDLTQEGRAPSTTSTFEGRSTQPKIDDTPVLVADFGLTFLNTGFI
tara:strand:- start:35445 stop:38984 length:3540 start_codon:yes stop_codon:yes gene_type:complete